MSYRDDSDFMAWATREEIYATGEGWLDLWEAWKAGRAAGRAIERATEVRLYHLVHQAHEAGGTMFYRSSDYELVNLAAERGYVVFPISGQQVFGLTSLGSTVAMGPALDMPQVWPTPPTAATPGPAGPSARGEHHGLMMGLPLDRGLALRLRDAARSIGITDSREAEFMLDERDGKFTMVVRRRGE
jgi:hypothetical protein